MKQFYVKTLLTVLCSLTTTIANVQWSQYPTVNTPICTASGDQMLRPFENMYQSVRTIVSDGAGGAIITWWDNRSGTYFDIYAQRISAAGIVQWLPLDGVPICTAEDIYTPNQTIVSDGSGGAIIAWHDYRNGAPDIYAQRISAAGIVQWAANGVPICTEANDQQFPTIVSDGSQGAIIDWQDHRSGNGYDIYAQRISAAGIVQWTPSSGVLVATGDPIGEHLLFPFIVSDGAGGAIVTWSNSSECWLYAQRIDALGAVKWTPPGGIRICTDTHCQARPVIASDGVGGAIISWEDHRAGCNIYAQRIDGGGALKWAASGVAICRSPKAEAPDIVSDGAEGAIITWNDDRPGLGVHIYARRISAGGVAKPTVPICTAVDYQIYPVLISYGTGGTIISWEDYRNGNADVYAQCIDGNDKILWTANGVAISMAAGDQSFPTIIDGGGGAIITWMDSRNGYRDIYAQNVNSSGGLDEQMLGSISGKKFDDSQVGKPGLPNWTIQLTSIPPSGSPLMALTDANGEYYFGSVSAGTYTLSEVAKPNWNQTVPGSPFTYPITLLPNGAITGKDFGNQAATTIQDLQVDMIALYPRWFRSPCCGQDVIYLITYQNLGTVSVNWAHVDLHFSSYATYQSSTGDPPLSTATVDTTLYLATWDLPSPLLPGAQGIIEAIVTLTKCTPPDTPQIVSTAIIGPSVSDPTPSNDTAVHAATVRCSYDPNDKQVTPKGCGTEGFIAGTDSLTYLIQFQNTGSAPADRVILRDTLDDDLNLTTIVNLGSSHPNIFEVNGRELKWTFPHIELPDSATDEIGSQGYVKFRIKPRADASNGVEITNRAAIYFDLNTPVMTNTTTNTITDDPLPVASFTVTPTCSSDTCRFDFVYTGGTPGATFLWNFGHGANPETSSAQNPTGIRFGGECEQVAVLQVQLGDCISEPAIQRVVEGLKTACRVSVNRRWNLVSVPVTISDYSRNAIFPSSITEAWAYEGTYVQYDTLTKGKGYWLKFNSPEITWLIGYHRNSDTIPVSSGWNLIGSITEPIDVWTIVSDPPGMITSQFFGYQAGYTMSNTIQPGKGYWVKVREAGKLILSTSGLFSSATKIRIIPTSELPPPAPEGVKPVPDALPTAYALEQNYPNPFNPITAIRYQLPVDSKVLLRLYNMLGEEVKTLVNETQNAGFKLVEWNSTNNAGQPVANGIYFYRLITSGHAGTFVDTKKLILLR